MYTLININIFIYIKQAWQNVIYIYYILNIFLAPPYTHSFEIKIPPQLRDLHADVSGSQFACVCVRVCGEREVERIQTGVSNTG